MRIGRWIAAVVGSPLLWGALATLGFYTLLESYPEPTLVRYFAGHWVEYVTTAMFFVAVATLTQKAFDVAAQRAALRQPLLGETPPELPAEAAREFCAHLAQLPAARQQGYLPQRLKAALEGICRKGSAETLDGDLRYLSELDEQRMHNGYAFVRIIIWAVPILGFLGTVIGITMAIADLSPEQLETSMSRVTAGLGVAFDTTALSLALSMGLMFYQFLVARSEGRLLAAVDEAAEQQLAGRFEIAVASQDPNVAAVRRIGEQVLASVGLLAERQAEIWQQSLVLAEERWAALLQTTGKQLQTALSGALRESLREHAVQLAEAEADAAASARERWRQTEQALENCALAIGQQQPELVKQGDMLFRIVDALGQVTRLEDALNRNLGTLAGAQHFQETMLNLSAALTLLNARLGQLTAGVPTVELRESKGLSRAA